MAESATNVSTSWWESLTAGFNRFYEGIASKVSNPFTGLMTWGRQSQNPDRTKIDALREKHYQLIDKESKATKPDYNKITKIITQDTRGYINQIIAEEQRKLGKAPCEFNVFTLGSMARQESGPVTDLEIGFLVKEKNVEAYKYFYQLSQNISDRLFLLGEHPDVGGKGLRMDEADNAPPHKRFFARNLNNSQVKGLVNEAVLNREWDKLPFEGSRPFLATPQEFASFSDPNFVQNKDEVYKKRKAAFDREWKKAQNDPKNRAALRTAKGRENLRKEIQHWNDEIYRPYNPREIRTINGVGLKLGRNIDSLYGNRSLFDSFYRQRETYFAKKEQNGKTLRQNIAKSKMKEDVQDRLQKGKNIFVTGELGKTLDIKRELYRFGEQFITNLGFYHQCKNQNTIDLTNELVAKGVLHPEVATTLVDYMQFASGLRLKEQRVIKRQGFAAYFDQAEFDEDKEKLEKEITNLKSSIDYMTQAKFDVNAIAAKKRDLAKLESKFEHLMDMAPGKIYSEEDVNLLRTKYAPMAKRIFNLATQWTEGKERLGFDSDLAALIAPYPQPKPVVAEPKIESGMTPDMILRQEWTGNYALAFDHAYQRYQAMNDGNVPSSATMAGWARAAGISGPQRGLFCNLVAKKI